MAVSKHSEPNDEQVTAVVICEVRNAIERRDFELLTKSVGCHGDLRLLADGVLLAYMLRLPVDGAPLLTALHVTLRNEFLFGQVVSPVQETVLSVVRSLAEETGGQFYPAEVCSICGEEAWFPASVSVRGEDGRQRPGEKVYCAACARTISDPKRNGKAPAPSLVEKASSIA